MRDLKMAPKGLFLDVDWVLNTDDCHNHPDPSCKERIHQSCLDSLNTIIRATGAKCILSSDWRFSHNGVQMTDFLRKFGFIGEVIDTTAQDRRCRSDQIISFMDTTELSEFVILDDLDLLSQTRLPSVRRVIKARFVQTDPKVGLTQAQALEAIRILNGA